MTDLIRRALERVSLLLTPVGLGLILAFIGVKLILVFLHEDVSKSVPEIPTSVSLGVNMAVLLITTIASLLRVRKHPEERAHAGSLRVTREPKRADEERSPEPGS